MKSRLLRKLCNLVEGEAQLERAMKLRKELVPDDKRTEDELGYQDFDNEVWYYSR